MNGWELTVVPAYGRDYQTSDEAFAAWMDDRDFYIMTPGHPSYINKADAEKFDIPNGVVRLRFKNKTELLLLRLDKVTRQWINEGATDDESLEE